MNEKKGKIAVIGDKASIFPFMAVGFDTYFAEDVITAGDVLNKIASSGEYAIIYITEDLMVALLDTVEKYKDQPTPAIIALPGIKGSTGFGVSEIKKSVERAVGSDILFKDQS